MLPKVFIDGEAGTTGLQIADRLRGRTDLELISIDPDKRKDHDERARLMNMADAVIMCLPDEAARLGVSLVTSQNTVIIDASSAHRTAPGWTYGFPEMDKAQRSSLRATRRIANPGCYPTGHDCPDAPTDRSWPRAGVLAGDGQRRVRLFRRRQVHDR